MSRLPLQKSSHTLAVLVATIVCLGTGSTWTCHEITEARWEVAAMRLTVGTQVIKVDDFGTVTGGPIVIPIGRSSIIAAFLDSSGKVVGLPEAELRFEVRTTDNTATFSRTGKFTGTLVGVTAGHTTMAFALYDSGLGHVEFGYHDVPVTVR